MKRTLLLLKSYFPSALPIGMTEFNQWSNEIIELVGPLADSNSIKFALASQIMHLSSTSSYVPKNYFVKCLRKTAANQVAAQVFQDVKQAQKDAAEAAAKEAQQLTAADTATQAVSDVAKVL